jgi:putative transcriptional regulator
MNALLQGWRNVFFAGFLIAAAFSARSENLDRPVLLVAQPDLQGMYSQTALLAVPTPGGQHVGFILNRVTDVTLAKLFPEHAPSSKVVDPVYFGGPEMLGAIFAIVRRDPGVPSLRLFGDLFVTGNGEAVDRIIEQTPNEARYFTGFVGWQAGELARELEAGYWYVTEPDPALLFSDDAGGAMWEQLLRRAGKPAAPGMKPI